MSFPTRSNHSHNARDHADSVIVHYKFHPLSGKHVQIVGTREKPEGDTFIVRDVDGRRRYVPAWKPAPPLLCRMPRYETCGVSLQVFYRPSPRVIQTKEKHVPKPRSSMRQLDLPVYPISEQPTPQLPADTLSQIHQLLKKLLLEVIEAGRVAKEDADE
jgi:hypothetical protein